MSETAISISGLSKHYRLRGREPRYRTLRDTLSELASAPFRRNGGGGARAAKEDEIWALKDVSFEVRRGEVVGVIGQNGAGKSTLLKILSRITDPTRGFADIEGRVGSLLEVGTGFHPELTGRENIFLNGAILGMKRADIEAKFDEVVAFAEVERFVDTPVKFYSSGMYLRLAFAVAAHLEPEILLVDEVLAVGDASFQRKCLGKIGQVARGGRTVLFVSHNMTALQSLCDRAVWLHNGQVEQDGNARLVVGNYLKSSTTNENERVWPDAETAPGNDTVRLRQVRLSAQDQEPGVPLTVSTSFEVEVAYWNFEPEAVLNVSLVFYTLEDVCVFNVISEAEPRPAGLVRQVCEIPGDLLNDGSYRVRLLIVRDTTRIILDLPSAVSFEVHEAGRTGQWYGKWLGVVRPALRWRTAVVEEADGVLR